MSDNQSQQVITFFDKKKSDHLVYSLIIDFVGIAGMAIPFAGELFDVIWAPISAISIFIMYRKTAFKARAGIGSIVGFTEELMPYTDILPTATLMWAFTYHVERDKTLTRIAKRRYKDIAIVDGIASGQNYPSLWRRIKGVFNPKALNAPFDIRNKDQDKMPPKDTIDPPKIS